jgi:hypothetical protein
MRMTCKDNHTFDAAMLGQGQIAIVARACNEGELA